MGQLDKICRKAYFARRESVGQEKTTCRTSCSEGNAVEINPLLTRRDFGSSSPQ
jgi:hypothetical protein